MEPHDPSVGTPNWLDGTLPWANALHQGLWEATLLTRSMMTEWLHLGLWGGLLKTSDQMPSSVPGKVEAALPDSASARAERTAHVTATQAAGEEAQALEARSGELTRHLAQHLQETEKRLQNFIVEAAHTLTSRIEEAQRRSAAATEEAVGELARQIENVDGRASEASRTVLELTGQIERTAGQIREAVQTEINQRVGQLQEEVRQGRAGINARLEALEGGTARLSEHLLGEREARTAEWAAAQVEAQRSAASTLQRLEQVAQELASRLEESQARLHDEVRQLRQANEVLAARVAELERPRSLRWYYCLDGKTAQGPVTAAQLKELIRSRRLVPTSKVSLDGKKWHPASHLKGVQWV